MALPAKYRIPVDVGINANASSRLVIVTAQQIQRAIEENQDRILRGVMMRAFGTVDPEALPLDKLERVITDGITRYLYDGRLLVEFFPFSGGPEMKYRIYV